MSPRKISAPGQLCRNAAISLPEDMIRLLDQVSEVTGRPKSAIALEIFRNAEAVLRRTLIENTHDDETRATGSYPIQAMLPVDAWSQLVAPTLISRARREKAAVAISKVLAAWPNEILFLNEHRESPSKNFARFRDELGGADLGYVEARLGSILSIAARLRDFGPPATKKDVIDITGLGDYAADSYRIFYLGDRSINPKDEELRKYLGLEIDEEATS